MMMISLKDPSEGSITYMRYVNAIQLKKKRLKEEIRKILNHKLSSLLIVGLLRFQVNEINSAKLGYPITTPYVREIPACEKKC